LIRALRVGVEQAWQGVDSSGRKFEDRHRAAESIGERFVVLFLVLFETSLEHLALDLVS
jgi:hypothetical protein